MSRTLTFVSLMALGAALVGGAGAQTTMDKPAHQHHGRGFDAMDTNKDGVLDKSEAKGRLAKAFDEIDLNKDGKVTKDELKAGWQAQRTDRQAQRLARIDTDKDGKVSWAESEAQAKARFDKADANHDGFLDASEMTARKGWRHHDKDMAPQQGR
ncbi:EF-hand domain-containing protein [Asticcacaulis sp.]|uniref:EF-hand domain-containing protein n=1 Tax=Asticcacaulis sp. TaxID=1872648 RepID=UPI002CD69AB8|nr:EF-hand domain-containing protein [Asticcacaulis sp.]HTM82138.1 EF-hand domain-containing protein [Asticcacaulis sp.]